MEEEYNGWTNKETWAVKLHWDNNQGDQEFFSEQAREYEKVKGLHDFADFLRDTAETIFNMVIDEGQGTSEAKNFVKDVGSLWRVNWQEIAKAYFDECDR